MMKQNPFEEYVIYCKTAKKVKIKKKKCHNDQKLIERSDSFLGNIQPVPRVLKKKIDIFVNIKTVLGWPNW